MAPTDVLYITSGGLWNTNESIQSQVALFVLKFCNSASFKVVAVEPDLKEDGDLTSDLIPGVSSMSLNLKAREQGRNNQTSQRHSFGYEGVDFERIVTSNMPEVVLNCPLPAIMDSSEQLGLCGLSTVLRRIILLTNQEQHSDSLSSLLGFRQTSLKSCAEASVWTKLIDSCVTKDVADFCQDVGHSDSFTYLPPESVVNLEQKLSQPVSTYNIHHQQRQRSGQDGKLTNSEVAFETVVSNYKTEKIIVNKKAYKEAIKAYKVALEKGDLKPDTKFKDSEFYISLDRWREKMAKGDENGTRTGDQSIESVYDCKSKDPERVLEQRLLAISAEGTSISGFEMGEMEGNCDGDSLKDVDVCNFKHLENHFERESNETTSGKRGGHLSRKRSSENQSLPTSFSAVSANRTELDALKELFSNSQHDSVKSTNNTNRSNMSPARRNDSEDRSKKQSSSESNLKHIFTEGSNLTLTDLALFVPIHIFVKIFKERGGNFSTLQHLVSWYKRMLCLQTVKRTALEMGSEQILFDHEFRTTSVDVAIPVSVN